MVKIAVVGIEAIRFHVEYGVGWGGGGGVGDMSIRCLAERCVGSAPPIDVSVILVIHSALSLRFCMLQCDRVLYCVCVCVLIDWVKFVVLPMPIYL